MLRRGFSIYSFFADMVKPMKTFPGDEADGWDEAIVPYDAMLHI